jgi:hypothetical protein
MTLVFEILSQNTKVDPRRLLRDEIPTVKFLYNIIWMFDFRAAAKVKTFLTIQVWNLHPNLHGTINLTKKIFLGICNVGGGGKVSTKNGSSI